MGDKFSLFDTKWKKVFFAWMILSVLFWLAGAPYIVLGVVVSGLSTMLVWFNRNGLKNFVSGWNMSNKWKFILIGTLGAVWVETVFWIIAIIFEVNVAASNNLLLDYLYTMPWYFFMIVLFWKVQTKYKYSLYQILLLGGFYSWFAEGFVKTLVGEVPLLLFGLFSLTFPGNVLSYSFIVFPASLLLRDEILKRAKVKGKFRNALLPCLAILAIIPIVIIVGILKNL